MKTSLFYFVAALLFIFSCEKKESTTARKQMAQVVEVPDEEIMRNVSQSPQPIERKLIKTGQLDFETKNVKNSKIEIEKIIKELGAYSSNEEERTLEDRLQFSQTIRVPASGFDALLMSIDALASSTDVKSVNVQDVSEEYIDHKARLRAKKEVETRYREILKQAKTVQEILSVETEIGNARSEIESFEGRLKYLSDQVSMSTLSITYYQKIGTDFGFFSKLGTAFKSGWEFFLVFLIGAANLWPFILILSGFGWLLRRWRRHKRVV